MLDVGGVRGGVVDGDRRAELDSLDLRNTDRATGDARHILRTTMHVESPDFVNMYAEGGARIKGVWKSRDGSVCCPNSLQVLRQ